MGNIWFTSDHHFNHANIIKYCNRPFKSVEEMDEILIQRWNNVVGPNDMVYYLGDFTLKDTAYAEKIIYRLNGGITFVAGSHDYRWIYGDAPQLIDIELRANSGDYLFVLCHYAMRVWNRSHYGSFHLYGHSHGTLPGLGRSMDVGVDTNNFYPYNIDEIVKKLSKIEIHNKPEKENK